MTEHSQEIETPSDGISKEGFAAKLVVKATVVEGWMRRHFTRGAEYDVIGRTTIIYEERARACLRQIAGRKELGPAAAGSRSASSRIVSRTIQKPSPVTRVVKLVSPQR